MNDRSRRLGEFPAETAALFERLSNRATMLEAEQELIELGEEAVPIREALLDGSARNRFGVPYRKLGQPLICSLVVASRLGPIARPLEPFLRDELRSVLRRYAAQALGALGRLEEASILALADGLAGDDWDLSSEAAVALLRCGQAGHQAVVEACARSERAALVLKRSSDFLAKEAAP